MSDLTLISKVDVENINSNLQKRFEHGEIYVGSRLTHVQFMRELT